MAQNASKAVAAKAPAASLDFDGLDGLLGFRLRVAQAAMHRDFLAALAAVRISQRQTGALWLIGANPGASQAELADALMMDRATMVAIIDRLQADGRIIRKRSKTDRRRYELYLTPKGVKALAAAKKAIAGHETRAMRGMDAGQAAALMAGLARLTGRDPDD